MKIKLLILVCLLVQTAGAQTERALIFAIGNYPDGYGWNALASANDAQYISRALAQQHFTDIKVVSDQGATVDGMEASLESLIGRSQPGDIVVIHVSSHGQRIEDEKGTKLNKLEECIVGYGAVYYDAPVTREKFDLLKKNYFREDDFGGYVRRLRARLGTAGDLVIFMDLCHASVGIRGLAKVRGGRKPIVTDHFTGNINSTGASEDITAAQAGVNLCPYTVIGASRAEEPDVETEDDERKDIGPLSYAVSKALLNPANLEPLTYEGLFAQVKSTMNVLNPAQHPVSEDAEPNRIVFGKKFIRQTGYITMNSISGNQVGLDQGTLCGLGVGARVAVYQANTHDTLHKTPLGIGKVTKASVFASIVTLDQPLAISQPGQGWVFVQSPVYPFDPVSVQLDAAFSTAEAARMKEALSRYPLIRSATGRPDLRIAKGKGGDSVIIASSGYCFSTLNNAARDTDSLATRVLNYMQYLFLRKTNVNDGVRLLDIRLVRVKGGQPDTSAVNKPMKDYVFEVGDTVRFWVRNKTKKAMYFNMLDLTPDGQVGPLIPLTQVIDGVQYRITKEEARIEAGNSGVVGCNIGVAAPTGTEVVKVFVSDATMDMEKITTLKGAGIRGSLAPFEILVNSSYNAVRTKGGTDDAVPPVGNENGSAYNLLFEIKAP